MASKKSEFELLLRIVGSMDPSVVNAANMTKRQLQKMKSDIDSADSLLWGGLTKAAKIGVAAIAAAGTAKRTKRGRLERSPQRTDGRV